MALTWLQEASLQYCLSDIASGIHRLQSKLPLSRKTKMTLLSDSEGCGCLFSDKFVGHVKLTGYSISC